MIKRLLYLSVACFWGATLCLPAHAQGGAVSKHTGPVDPSLLYLIDQGRSTALSLAALPTLRPDLPVTADGRMVLIEAATTADAATLLGELEALGLRGGGSYGAMVSGWLPVAAIPDLSDLNGLRFVRPSYLHTQTGTTISQGDAAMGSTVARAAFGVDGTGVQVGILSDSYGCLPNAAFPDAPSAADDEASGDVPAVTVLQDLDVIPPDFCASGTDEGRGMAQIVHDVAPGADLLFHTANGGPVNFALGILALAGAGADVIVDDIIYFAEPMFQDGLVAQAVDLAHELGVTYLSAAGNNDRAGYEAAFRGTGLTGAIGGELHDFDPGAGVDPFMRVTIPAGGLVRLVLQWDDPFFSASGSVGAGSDLDIYLADPASHVPIVGSVSANIGADAVEVIAAVNSGTAPATLDLVIEHFDGPVPTRMKMVRFGDTVFDAYDTRSPTLYGHANAAGAEAVGAAAYFLTPPFGLVTEPRLNGFSASGPQPILFSPSGNRLAEPIIRRKPEITAPDGVNTTMFPPFGLDVTDLEPDGFPNFFGTSAAAPHAAGLAALMLELNPGLTSDEIVSAMERTALDILVINAPGLPATGPGFDFDSGFGLVQAEAALAEVVDETPPVCSDLTVAENGPFLGHTFAQASAVDAESGIASLQYRLRNALGFFDLGNGPQRPDGRMTSLPLPRTPIHIGGEKRTNGERARVVIDITNGAGLTTTCDPVMTTLVAEAPQTFSLDPNYPNPFNPSTTISFGVPEAAPVRLDVFDVLGRRVATLIDEHMEPGRYHVTWDGVNEANQNVAGGIYIYRLTAGSYTATRSMSFLK